MKTGEKRTTDPDLYVAGLGGWQRSLVVALRATVLAAAPLDEQIKWTHLVYFSNGPVTLIRAESHRVLLGFWRGKRLATLEPRLKPGGKYEMATIALHEGDAADAGTVSGLVREAVRLNAELGDPTKRLG